MFLEMLVLDGGDRAVQDLGALLVSHQNAALQCEAACHLPVICVNFRDHVRAISFQSANLRQVAGVNKKQPAARTKRNGAKH